MRKTFLFLYVMFTQYFICHNVDLEKNVSLQPFPFFRRQVEEIFDETNQEPGRVQYPSENIVNFLVDNADKVLRTDDESDIIADSVNDLRKQKYPKIIDIFEDGHTEKYEQESLSDPDHSAKDKNVTLGFLNKLPDNELHQRNIFNKIHELESETVNKNKLSDFRLNKEFKPVTEDDVIYSEDTIGNHNYTSTILDNIRVESVNNIQKGVENENARDSLNITSETEKIDFENKIIDLNRKYSLRRMNSFNKLMDDSELLRPMTYHKYYKHKSKETKFTNDSNYSAADDLLKKIHSELDNKYRISLDPLPFFKDRRFFEPVSVKVYPIKYRNVTDNKQDTNTNKCTETDGQSSCDIQNKTLDIQVNNQRKLSCIKCDNAAIDWCSAPLNKLIPSTICEHETDVCYSMHTPFGIIERGCYSALQILSVYVCSCNLCNYQPFIEMPVIFASKKEWIQNVYDISHLGSLQKNTLKSISCLECSVNGTIEGDAIYNVNCLEGHVGMVRTVVCQEGEICGVKAIKKQGYIWRGCLRRPRYNYFLTLCEEDLCNYEPIASLYDTSD